MVPVVVCWQGVLFIRNSSLHTTLEYHRG